MEEGELEINLSDLSLEHASQTVGVDIMDLPKTTNVLVIQDFLAKWPLFPIPDQKTIGL